MSTQLENFYNSTSSAIDAKVLDGFVDFKGADFEGNSEFISKSGIKKNVETDAIEIILDLVKMGKIDPWNIDIVDLYDKYTARIKELKQDSLRSVGKAILFSSILLKIKSDILKGVTIEDFEPEDFFDDDDDFMDGDYEQLQIPTNNVVSFDEVLQRRTSVRLNRKRNVTLDDLLKHIQFYENLEKKYAIKGALDRKERRVRNYANLKASDIKNLAHEEYIEEMVEKMRQNLTQIFKTEEEIELRDLCVLGFDKTNAYVSLLFLERENQWELYQEEFYSDLFIRKVKEEAGA